MVAVENFVVILPCAFAQLALQFSFLHFTSCIPLFGLVFVSCISLSELCRQEVAMETYLLPRQLLSSPVITFAPPALQYLLFHPKDLIRNSPYCLPYNSYDVTLENLVLDLLIIPKFMFSLFSSLVCLIL